MIMATKTKKKEVVKESKLSIDEKDARIAQLEKENAELLEAFNQSLQTIEELKAKGVSNGK